MMARRVGFVPTPSRRSSASGWIEPGDQPEGGARRVAGHGLVDRGDGCRPSRPTMWRAVGCRRFAHGDAARPEHPLGVVAGRHGLA